MTFRRFATGAALALVGLAAAVGIGLLANTISGDSVGLGAEPLSAGETLAPAEPRSDDREDRQRQRRNRNRNRNRGGDDGVRTTPTSPTEIAPPTTTTEDNSGSDNSGSGSEDSGQGRGRGRGGDGISGGDELEIDDD